MQIDFANRGAAQSRAHVLFSRTNRTNHTTDTAEYYKYSIPNPSLFVHNGDQFWYEMMVP
jgi:hypothetical protein